MRLHTRVTHERLVLLLSLLLVLLCGPRTWYVAAPLSVCCLAALVFPSVGRSAHLWTLVGALVAGAVFCTWSDADNHKYLLAYWCLALALVLGRPREDREELLAQNARLLLGLTMAFATFWKLWSSSYLNGDFFTLTLLTDDRFAHMAHWVSGLGLETLAQNRELESALKSAHLDGITVQAVGLTSNGKIDLLSVFLTYWTVGIEGLIAILFLIPGKRIRLAGHVALLAFLATTYTVAPVIGFGWILAILGFAQCRDCPRLSVAYLGVFLLIKLYTMPWADAVTTLARG